MKPLNPEQLARLCNSNPFEDPPIEQRSSWGVILAGVMGVSAVIGFTLVIGWSVIR